MPSLIDSAVIISLVTGAWTISSRLTAFKAELATTTKSIEELKKSTANSIDELKKSMDESTKSTADSMAELSRVIAGVKLLGESTAVGIRELAAGATPVTAFVAATPAEVEFWLISIGFGEYARRQAPLGGSNVRLQTDASLRQDARHGLA